MARDTLSEDEVTEPMAKIFHERLASDLEAMGYAIGPVTKADTYTPPEGVQSAARRALKLIADGHAGDGFTDVGRKRASDLAAGRSVSLNTVKRMHSYFARHAVDKQGKDWDNAEKPSPGKVAWLAWGGDAGKSWANAIVNRDNVAKAYKRKYATQREAAQAAANARWGNRSPKVDAPAEPSGPVIEPWVDQKSAAAVDREFNRRWGDRTLMRLTGLPPEAANGSAEAINELLTLYPDTTLHLVGTQTGISQMIKSGTYPPGTPESVKSLASRGRWPRMQQSEGGDYSPQLQFIRINKNQHGSDGYGSISTQLSEETGWFTPTGAEGIRHAAKRSMVHEFGHAIDLDPKRNSLPSDFSNSNNPITKATQEITGAPASSAAANRAVIENNIGTYAAKNAKELFAETFTEYHMNPAARPLSVDFVKFRMGEIGIPLAAPSTLGTIAKAYKRKYATRIEAARVAARARWGNRSKTEQPASPKTNKPDESRAGFVEGRDLTQDPDAMKRLEETFDAIDAKAKAKENKEKNPDYTENWRGKQNLYIEAIMKEQGWLQPMRSLEELPATHSSAKRDVGKAEAKAYKNGDAITPIGGGLYGNGIYVTTIGSEGAGRPSSAKTLKLGIDSKALSSAKPYAHTLFSADPDEWPTGEFINGEKAGMRMGNREISPNLHGMMRGYSVVEVDGWGEKKRAPSNYDYETDKVPKFTEKNRGFPFGKGPGFDGYVVFNPTAIVYLGVEE